MNPNKNRSIDSQRTFAFAIALLAFIFLLEVQIVLPQEPDWCRHLPRPGYTNLKKLNTGSDWFEVYEIQPGLYAISEPRQYEEVISYLLVGSRRALLWDSGMGIASMKNVMQKLASVPVIVLNSHTHPDHIGGNYEFGEVWGMKTAFTEQNTKGYSDPEMKEWVTPRQICGELPAGFNPAEYKIRPFKISRFIQDGERIDLGDREVEVLHTPGHTPDALCLLDRKNRLLFTGDSFYSGPIYLYSPETNFTQYAASVKRLVALRGQLDFLLTSHNEPVSNAASLNALHAAVEQIRSGKMKPMDKEGLDEYFFQTFSILLKRK